MIRKIGLLMVFTAINPLGGFAQGIADIAASLAASKAVTADARFSVTLPQNDTDVTYDLGFTSVPTCGSDPLSPCDYLIEWSLPTPSGRSEGFSAYFDGHHYRYRDQRLQEYHTEWDSVPFIFSGSRGGIQSQAQFVDLLPHYLGREILTSLSDTTYIYGDPVNVTFDGRKAVQIKMRRVIGGETASERTYYFDPATSLPLRIDTESNPGSITEQSILVDYNYDSPRTAPFTVMTEEALIERYPEVFEKYRQSNFRIENLPGTTLPTFSLPTLSGDRFTHQRGEGLASPSIIAFIDPSKGFNADLIAQIRSAVESLPYQAQVIWAFPTNSRSAIEELTGESLPYGETAVTGAAALARDCGVAAYPVVVMADREGVVKKVVLGFNKDLADVVLQNMALIK
ncbi:MAG: hypothetical protein K2L14_04690 [Duncaniella sp.]|nr:hypothetical protein [Duncaniella sp.]